MAESSSPVQVSFPASSTITVDKTPVFKGTKRRLTQQQAVVCGQTSPGDRNKNRRENWVGCFVMTFAVNSSFSA